MSAEGVILGDRQLVGIEHALGTVKPAGYHQICYVNTSISIAKMWPAGEADMGTICRALPRGAAALAVRLLVVALAGCNASRSVSAHPCAPSNGAILSKTKVTSYSLPAAVLYHIVYAGRGQHVEAYLTVSTGRGPFPLVVYLHGGAAWHTTFIHYDFGYTAAMAAQLASSRYAGLYPEYQGYLGSSGDVMGLYTDTLDTLGGIRAAESTAPIVPHRIYLIGSSAGGGVALKVAGMLSGIRAIAAVSPYAGLRVALPWERAHAQLGTLFYAELEEERISYGAHPSPAVLSQESPDIATIRAPALLLQGTGDQHVPWQTVQEFYQAMKAAGKTVKLILYPGGHHGLHHTYGTSSRAAIRGWFQRYGLVLGS